jgi:hypothetical protein
MAIGKYSDFVIYQPEFYGALSEELAQSVAPLASVGITQQVRQIPGHYERRALIEAISGIVSRRDLTSVSAATDASVPMDEDVSVKLNRKIGPVAQTLDSWRKAGLPFVADWDPTGMRGLSSYLGAQIAKATQIDMLDAALLACRVFLEAANSASNLHTIAANGTMTTAALVTGLSKMGDRAESVNAWLMHSKPYFDLLQYQAAVSTGGTDLAFAVIQSAVPASLNRRIYVTDSASLVVTGTPNLYRTIGLVEGGIELITSETQELVSDVVTGLEQLVGRMQGEFAYNLGIKGAKWDMTNGGINPDATALGTASNWDLRATSMKDSAGVVIISG